MKILILEPYFTGSHKDWALGYKEHSAHEIKILSLPGRFWKWRMHGGAISLAKQFYEQKLHPDLILATDMLDLTTFLALTRKVTAAIPTAIYFHENQITYPWSPTDRDLPENRDFHYGFINITSALSADACFFNSRFHLDSFCEAIPRSLNNFPDEQNLDLAEKINGKSSVLHLGLDLKIFDKHVYEVNNSVPQILWNHRWEYDKNPEEFFRLLFDLQEKGLEFKVIILGENFSTNPEIFEIARKKLGSKVIQYGFAKSFKDYARLLWKADILPVTSNQEFFGASIMEAVYCKTIPVLPDRLTYPELFPAENIYGSYQDLLSNVEKLIRDFKRINKSFLRDISNPYDWATMGPVYDSTFEELVFKE